MKKFKNFALALLLLIVGSCSFILVGCTNEGKGNCYIQVTASSSERGSVYGNGYYKDGEQVTICALAKEGYKFLKWSDGNDQNPRTVTASQTPQYYTAYFEEGKQTAKYALIESIEWPACLNIENAYCTDLNIYISDVSGFDPTYSFNGLPLEVKKSGVINTVIATRSFFSSKNGESQLNHLLELGKNYKSNIIIKMSLDVSGQKYNNIALTCLEGGIVFDKSGETKLTFKHPIFNGDIELKFIYSVIETEKI